MLWTIAIILIVLWGSRTWRSHRGRIDLLALGPGGRCNRRKFDTGTPFTDGQDASSGRR
jgi:hypothetical protein